MNNQLMEEEYEETYDDYETTFANAPDITVMIYDQRAVNGSAGFAEKSRANDAM